MTVRAVRRRVAVALIEPAIRILALGWLKKPLHGVARRVVRAATPALRGVTDEDLNALAAAGAAGRLVLGSRGDHGVSPAALLDLADRPQRVAPVALALDHARGTAGQLGAALYETIALQQAGSTERTQAAMIAVRRHPELLSLAHAKGVAKRTLTLAAQPIDPYAPHPLRFTAAATAAALVAARPDLDSDVIKTLAQPNLRFVAAAAVQARRGEPERLLVNILAHTAPDEAAARRFAHACNRNFSVLDEVATSSLIVDFVRRAQAQLRRMTDRAVWLPRAVAVLLAGASAAAAGLLVDALVLDLPARLRAGGGVALAALALLVAVHLVSAELAADRLAGPIARATSVPLPLAASYVMAGLALALGQLSRSAIDPATRSATTYGLAAGFALGFALALRQLLARTDSAAAAVTFVRRRRARYRAAGRELGDLHAVAIKARDTIRAMPWVKATLSPPIAERRVRIAARRDGWLQVSQRQLRKLSEDDYWKRSAGRLWLAAPVGTRVDRGQEVAALTGDDLDGVAPQRVRQVRGLLRQQPAKGAEQTAEAVGVLVDLMVKQGAAGNEAGGFRVADATVVLIEAHLEGLAAARGDATVGEAGAPIPALRSAALAITHGMRRADHAAEREILERFVQRVLPLCGPDDPFCPTLLGELPRTAATEPATAAMMMWDIGVRVAECRSSVLTVSWTTALDAAIAAAPQHDRIFDVAGRVVAVACYVDIPTAHTLFNALHKHFDPERLEHVLTVLRVGGAAVRAGAMSVAIEVAIVCRPLQLAAWAAWAADHGNMTVESMRNELYGLTLGPDVQRVLQRFLDLAERTEAAL